MTTNAIMAGAFLVSATFLSNPAQAEDLVFTLKNGTQSILTRFYTSPVSTGRGTSSESRCSVLARRSN